MKNKDNRVLIIRFPGLQQQGYTQGGFSGFQQGPYNQQGQWRSHPGNQFNKDQGGPSNRPIQQEPNIFQRSRWDNGFNSNHKSTESALSQQWL